MLENRIREQLQDTFPTPNKALWEAAAQQETDGKNPHEVLSWTGAEKLGFSGYYDKTDLSSLEYLRHFQLTPSTDGFSGARAWSNVPQVTVSNIETAREQALQYLQNGADGVLFSFAEHSPAFTPALLQGIDWPYCNISFGTSQPEQLATLADYVQNTYPDRALQGIVLWNNTAQVSAQFCTAFPQTGTLKTLTLAISSADAITEIVTALTTAVALLDTTPTGNRNQTLDAIAFSLETGTDLFTTIAKFKALRLLWFQITHAYGHTAYQPHNLVLHARVLPWINEKYQPHGNMLRSTTASLAAVLGGCNSITVVPEDESHSTMQRIARNVSSILREESHLDKVADPLAGAYAVDTIVNSFAETAWKQFQQAVAAKTL